MISVGGGHEPHSRKRLFFMSPASPCCSLAWRWGSGDQQIATHRECVRNNSSQIVVRRVCRFHQ